MTDQTQDTRTNEQIVAAYLSDFDSAMNVKIEARGVVAALAAAGRLRDDTAPVVTLCGSSKFKDAINGENARLTREGNVVISLGMFGHVDFPDYDWTTDSSDLKTMLDKLHFQKIRMAGRVHVVNPNGYIGESTRREIAYAESLGLPVTYLEEAVQS